jgi:hypothetical protein
MANAQAEGRFILDTAGSSVVSSLSYFIKKITVTSLDASVANTTVFTDAAGVERWRWNGPTEQLIEKWWYGGFKLTVLDGGQVIVDVK